jgi:hypothetical protein
MPRMSRRKRRNRNRNKLRRKKGLPVYSSTTGEINRSLKNDLWKRESDDVS